MIGFAAGMEMADMAWEQKCREEDMKQRALENERHAIDDARRSVDEKAEQLKVLANQSALFAGFSMVVLVESNIPSDINGILLTVFGACTASVIALMLISSLNATYILVAILRYDCVNRDVPFNDFWRKRCESDWKLALKAFSYGVPLFMIVVALVAWLSFWDIGYKSNWFYISASVVTAIVLAVTIFWFGSTERKWGGFLRSDARVLTRGMSGNSTFQSPSSRQSRLSQMESSNTSNDRKQQSDNSVAESLDVDNLDQSNFAVGHLSSSDSKMPSKWSK